jgi:hypothetical protein
VRAVDVQAIGGDGKPMPACGLAAAWQNTSVRHAALACCLCAVGCKADGGSKLLTLIQSQPDTVQAATRTAASQLRSKQPVRHEPAPASQELDGKHSHCQRETQPHC